MPFTLVTVTVGPANGPRALPEEAPRVGLPVRVPAVAVVAEPPPRVLDHIVWKLCPFQTGGARVRLGHSAIVVSQLSEAFRARERHCRERWSERGRRADEEKSGSVLRLVRERHVWPRSINNMRGSDMPSRKGEVEELHLDFNTKGAQICLAGSSSCLFLSH